MANPSSHPSAAPRIATSYPQTLTTVPTYEPSTCTNEPDWYFEHQYIAGWAKEVEIRECDDDSVDCCHLGNLGYARDYCCKCKPANYECKRDPDEDGFPIALQVLTCVSFVFITLFSFKMVRESELRQIRQTMNARRQQQRENNEQRLAEEEMNNARYELFSSRFLFQEVLPDKSNITFDGLRRSSMKLGADNLYEEEETKTEVADGDESVIYEDSKETSDQTLARRLSDWRKPAPKDECCICLDCYVAGETICAPITEKCIHIFHEECIHEWIKRGNDKCPLCRVELFKD
ncbi:MAG: hypothetical protein SGBAC_006962 [Bacillariaceae sp.]